MDGAKFVPVAYVCQSFGKPARSWVRDRLLPVGVEALGISDPHGV